MPVEVLPHTFILERNKKLSYLTPDAIFFCVQDPPPFVSFLPSLALQQREHTGSFLANQFKLLSSMYFMLQKNHPLLLKECKKSETERVKFNKGKR